MGERTTQFVLFLLLAVFFWSCALSLNVSWLLEVLAIAVGFFFITELEAEVIIIFNSLLNTIVVVSLYCQRFRSF